MTPGMVDSVSPASGDIHSVRNALAHAPSISIHVYGGNIGAIRRSVFLPDGSEKEFISGYSEPMTPQ
jgi:predicted metal-dependent enzyme (double-stranded beta helix superfamily)